ncbi:MAG: hypothetical protein WCY05_03145 [Candidatus Omnitrophota bacterium]
MFFSSGSAGKTATVLGIILKQGKKTMAASGFLMNTSFFQAVGVEKMIV